MCFSGLFGGGNDAADEARRAREDAEARERERQRKIAQGEAYIDQIFAQFAEPNAPGMVDVDNPPQPSTPTPQQPDGGTATPTPTYVPQPGDVMPGGDVWTQAQIDLYQRLGREFQPPEGWTPPQHSDPTPTPGTGDPADPDAPSGPSFYDTFAQTYRDAYFPQLEQQYGQAQDKMAATLADRGVLESTPGAAQMSDLLGRYNQTRSQVESDAQGAVNDMRGRVQSAKTDLYGMNAVAANPEAAMAQAQAQATALAAPQSYSPLGQVFESFLHNAGAFNQANRNSVNPMSFNSGPRLYNPSGSGSSTVVG